MNTREEAQAHFLDRAKHQLAEIDQYFHDVNHWNDSRTRFDRIDPDPDGSMAARRKTLTSVIDNAASDA